MSDYKIEDGAEWSDARNGPKLDAFDEVLKSLKVNQFFRIALKTNGKDQLVPERGFNLKAANVLYGPDIQFKKARVEPKGKPGEEGYVAGYIKVQRVK